MTEQKKKPMTKQREGMVICGLIAVIAAVPTLLSFPLGSLLGFSNDILFKIMWLGISCMVLAVIGMMVFDCWDKEVN